ncbi:MAG: DUF389 domain-containing protein [Sphingomonadales bacterium]|nr:DUF389 domain-containing protein [Sphingomonadales bacterium]
MSEATSGTDRGPTGWREQLLHWRERLGRALLIPQLSTGEASELRQRIISGANFDKGYALMCCLSAGIAILGLLQSSTAVVIGAMLVSPLMGPIAALGIAFASLDGERIRQAARSIAAGAGIGIGTGMIITLISPINDVTAEILARTQPNLLDLAVALLSGLAGGYATIMAKGETAIGVAIATALMPPLATVGYGLGTMNMGYALGALLLFLTNLSAIAFAFALIARLSGAARLARNVEWSWRYSAILVAMFLILAVPLAMTMAQVKRELALRSETRRAITHAFGSDRPNITQLNVKWPMFGDPEVHAVTIAGTYVTDLDQRLLGQLTPIAGKALVVGVQQVMASDTAQQARAMANAATERGLADFVASGPPFDDIRNALGIPVRSMWSDWIGRAVYVEPFEVPGWSLSDYRSAEARQRAANGGWVIRIVPPLETNLSVDAMANPDGSSGEGVQIALWALARWGVSKVDVDTAPGGDASSLEKEFARSGVTANLVEKPGLRTGQAVVHAVSPPVADRARQ